MEVLLLLLVALVNILLGVTVYLSNSGRDSNKAFLALTVAFSFWTFANYWTTIESNDSLIFPVRATIFLACFISLFVWLTVKTFPDQHFRSVKFIKTQVAYVCIVAILTLTPLVFEEVAIVDGATTTKVGPLVPLFGLLALGFIAGATLSIARKFRRTAGPQKKQALIVLLGIGATFISILFTNFVLVLIFDVGFFLAHTSVFSLIFSSFFAYAIIKHRFLNIRAIVARSVGYMMLIGFFSLLYGVVIYGLSAIFFSSAGISSIALLVFTAFAVLFGLTFQPLRRVFDRISSKIFFRDAYDSQFVLNQLAELLARTIQLEEIMNRSSDILGQNLKPEFVSFIVLDEGRVYRQTDTGLPIASIRLAEILEKHSQQIVVSSEIESGELKRALSKHDVEIAAQLVTQDEIVGYLLLGVKKSGNIYSSQDIKLLNIITNELSIAIQNARNFEQIQEFNLTLQKKIEDATHKLRHSNEKLKALDEAKDEFISMASHQLRTPLTSIKGYVSMVLDGDAGQITPKQEELLKSAFTSSQRMVYLISDLLNVSRLKTGKFVIEAKEVFLPDVVEGEVMQLQETAKNRKLQLIYKKPKKFPSVMLDETKIRQVIMNFADNAIYYTPAGGKIKVVLEYDKHSVSYKVIDNGIGVPKEEQHKLFSKFYRAGNARKARPDGTGLGLFMAKKVVIAQGGAILFETHPGKGSTFGFTFPLSKVAAPKK